jgi:RNA polymerase sigma factor (sigma-70 family)
MPKDSPDSEWSSADILAGLRSPRRSEAWKVFLRRYSPTIMQIATRYEYDQDRHQDCYLFICEKLSDNNFRRLLTYGPEGSASFRSWLSVVVANLCIDWKRHAQGRTRPFLAIRNLSMLDQMVFKYRFQQGLEKQACMAMLENSFPGVTEPQVASAVSRINATLTQNQQWLLVSKGAKAQSLDEPGATELSEPGPDPEQVAVRAEQLETLQQALSCLSKHHRLLIKMRYQQELSLKEIARLTRLGDPFRARRHIQAALKELQKFMDR